MLQIMKPSTAWWMVVAGAMILAGPGRAQQTFTITGTVTTNGQGLADVTMVLGGAQADTTTTAENGEYTFTALSEGTYTVTPEREGYAFAPSSLMITFPTTSTVTPVFEASMVATSTEAGTGIPTAFGLEQNHPNPFYPKTVIRYHLAQTGPVRLDVLNLLGRTVAVLVDDTRAAGTYTATFDARALPSGLYLYRLQAGPTVRIRKMVLAK